MVRGTYVDRGRYERITLGDALDRYLAEISSAKRPSTAASDRFRARVLKEYLGRYTLLSLTPEIISCFRDDRLSEGKSDSSVRLELALLSHLFTVAMHEWRLGLVRNPVALVRKPRPAPGRNRRLGPTEENRLLEACDSHSNPLLGWLVRLALHTGMRQGEILSLTRDQVDLERRIVRLTETKNGGARTVPLNRAATAVLESALAYGARPIDTPLIFFGERGRDGRRRPYCFHRAWSDALKRAKITGLRFHDLRHEAVSRFVEAGLSDQEVAAISGHRSMQTLKRYTHLRAESLVAKLDQIDPR